MFGKSFEKSSTCYFSSCINGDIRNGLADDGKDEYELVEIDLGDITKRSIGFLTWKSIRLLRIGDCTQNQHRRGSKNQPIASR